MSVSTLTPVMPSVAKAGDTMTGPLVVPSVEATSYLKVGSGAFPSSGTIRLPNGFSVLSRNGADDADFNLLALNPSNSLSIGKSATGNMFLDASAIYARASSLRIGTSTDTLANTGMVRMPNGAGLFWRNAANDANISLSTNGSDQFVLSTANSSSGAFVFQVAGTTVLSSNASALAVNALRVGTNYASAGAVRLANAASISWRNAANNADVPGVYLDSSNSLALNTADTTAIHFRVNTVSKAYLGDNYLAIGTALNPATTGHLRLPYQGSIWTRNATNDGDKALLAGGVGYTAVFALAGEAFYVNIGGANPLEVSAANGLKTSLPISTGTNPAQAGQVRMPNTTWLAGRNSSNDADVLIIRNSGYLIDIGGANVTAVNITPGALAIGANAASTGAIRIGNNVWVSGRTADNLGDIGMLSTTTADHTMLNAITGKNIFLAINGTRRMSIADTSVSTQAGVSMAIGGDSLSIGATPATAGAFRMAAGQALYWRDAGNTANHLVLQNAGGVTTLRGEDYVNITTNGGTFLQASASSVNVTAGATFSLADGVPVTTGTTTGTKLMTATNQKFAAWNKTPDVQPTTAITGAAFVANSGTAINDASTFGGYTMAQVVAALVREGWLA